MTVETKTTVERIRKTIEKMDLFRDLILEDFADILRNPGKAGLTLKENCYINAAATEFKDFYFEDAIAALEIALKERS